MKTNAQPGDFVEIHLSKIIYEGTLLESPKDETNVILLKLSSGYNIGVNRKDIFEIKVLRKFEKKEQKEELKRSEGKPSIAVILTGGTIASKLDSRTGGVSPLTEPSDFFKFYPEMFKKVNVVKVEVPFTKSSEDMDFKDWQKIAKTAEKLLNNPEIQGIIVTHGTDFLHYTSAALSFFLQNLNKPVVLTYSQRSIDRASSDADLNLQCAALATISDIAEVMLVGHAGTNDDFCYAMPGTKVRKLHSSRRDAFKVVNGEPIAKIHGDRIDILTDFNRRNNKGKVKLDAKFDDSVALVKIYPGQEPDILDFYLKKGYKGLVLEMSGLGHLPGKGSRTSWIAKLKEVQKRGITICATAQTIYGRLDPYVYSNAREILGTGVIYLEDMLSETALVKLGYVLAKTKNKDEVKKLMLTNMAHELNNRLEE